MRRANAPRVWPIPILLGVVTAVCLFVALIDDGHWDVVASIGLAAVVAYACVRGWLEPG